MHEKSSLQLPDRCPICGNRSFVRAAILWDELVEEWELDAYQKAYIDDQQGVRCNRCLSSLRSMTLASAILHVFGIADLFVNCCARNAVFRKTRVLEINEAGQLTRFLSQLPDYSLANFPQHDMQHLEFADSAFNLIVHSDTLEHVPDSMQGLKECRRVLAPGGFLIYTIPITPERLTRSRHGMPPSYHGTEGGKRPDNLVHREYGGDFWCELFEAGFHNIRIHRMVYPASMAVIAEG